MNIEIWLDREEETLSIVNIVKETEYNIHTTRSIAITENGVHIQIVDVLDKVLIEQSTDRFNYNDLHSNKSLQKELTHRLQDIFDIDQLVKSHTERDIAFEYKNEIHEKQEMDKTFLYDNDNKTKHLYKGYRTLAKNEADQEIYAYVYTSKGVYTNTTTIAYDSYITLPVEPTKALADDPMLVSIVHPVPKYFMTWLNRQVSKCFDTEFRALINRSNIHIPNKIIYNSRYTYIYKLEKDNDTLIAFYKYKEDLKDDHLIGNKLNVYDSKAVEKALLYANEVENTLIYANEH